MKKILSLIVFAFFISHISFSQSALFGKWIYAGTEEFGLVTPPDSAQKTDFITIMQDDGVNVCQLSESGKELYGKWVVNSNAKTITITYDATGKSKTYNIISITATELVLEYQTPDLVRTRYHYTK